MSVKFFMIIYLKIMEQLLWFNEFELLIEYYRAKAHDYFVQFAF